MNWYRIILTFVVVLWSNMVAFAQCSICTKTAQQLGEGPAKGLNTGIIYLAFMPLAIIGLLGLRWWRNEKLKEKENL